MRRISTKLILKLPKSQLILKIQLKGLVISETLKVQLIRTCNKPSHQMITKTLNYLIQIRSSKLLSKVWIILNGRTFNRNCLQAKAEAGLASELLKKFKMSRKKKKQQNILTPKPYLKSLSTRVNLQGFASSQMHQLKEIKSSDNEAYMIAPVSSVR